MAHRVVYTRPYDAEVEYLESSGTQWLDTGITANSDIKIDLEGIFKSNNTYTRFGCSSGESTDCFLFISTSNNDYLIRLGTGTINQVQRSIHTSKDIQRVIIEGSSKKANIYFTDGTVSNYTFTSENFNGTLSLILFGYNNKSSIVKAVSMRISRLKIYSNNILVKDLIPVRVGQVGYMYDKVSGKLFGNKGTGNFILGPDVANPVPNIRRVFRFGNKRFVMPMPYASKVEYLEVGNTNNCYIDTGILPSDSISVVAQIQVLDNYNGFLFEGGNSVSSAELGFLLKGVSSEVSFRYGNKTVSSKQITFPSEPFIISSLDNPQILVVNGTNISADSNTFSSQNSIYLFGIHRNDSISGTTKNCRVYYFKMYNSGTLVRDFIPVRIGTKGYMYDKVSGKLFGNSGTGQFILGNDIND